MKVNAKAVARNSSTLGANALPIADPADLKSVLIIVLAIVTEGRSRCPTCF